MKKSQLKQIIKEELDVVINEAPKQDPIEIYNTGKELAKQLRALQRQLDQNKAEYTAATANVMKSAMKDLVVKIQQIYPDAKVTFRNDIIRITIGKDYDITKFPSKQEIESVLNIPGTFNSELDRKSMNSYGEAKTLLLTPTKKYLKATYNLPSWGSGWFR